MLGFGSDNALPPNRDLRAELGLLPTYQPEFVELRTSETTDEAEAEAWADALNSAFLPEAPTHRVGGGSFGAVQYLLPRIALRDLSAFYGARAAYDGQSAAQRHMLHALLLEQGLLLCEPSTVIEGMAGASLGRGAQWIAVPLHELRGEDV